MNTEADLRAYLSDYPREVAFGDERPDAVFDRYHTGDFVITNDGLALDRQRLLDHVGPARKRALGVDVEVHRALVQDGRIAAHYTLTATMRNGTVIATEIFAFGDLADDGRLARIEQVTRTSADR